MYYPIQWLKQIQCRIYSANQQQCKNTIDLGIKLAPCACSSLTRVSIEYSALFLIYFFHLLLKDVKKRLTVHKTKTDFRLKIKKHFSFFYADVHGSLIWRWKLMGVGYELSQRMLRPASSANPLGTGQNRVVNGPTMLSPTRNRFFKPEPKKRKKFKNISGGRGGWYEYSLLV